MILKIFNTEVVDCSSSWNEVVPNPQSRKLLLDIFLKICESEAIVAISHLSLTLDFQGSLDRFSQHRSMFFESPHTFRPHNKVFQKDKATFQSGMVAEADKIAGLFVEPKELTIQRIEEQQQHWKDGAYLLPLGLRGIHKAISIIHSSFSRNYNNAPQAGHHKDLKNFTLSAGVVWKEWALYKDDPHYGTIIEGEFDGIEASTEEMQLYLGGICEGGNQGRENGSKHYPSIQKVLDENWPGMFEVKELNGG